MRRLIDSGTATERLAAYSRAVVEDEWIFVSGTMGADPATGQLATDVTTQALTAFATIEAALEQAGASLADVVRCRVFITNREDLPAVAQILRQKFERIRPANTTVVCQLPVPEARIEVEVTAKRGRGQSGIAAL
jgi:enamine deaminase RidA (YjgF/YER057c/UK114 family)